MACCGPVFTSGMLVFTFFAFCSAGEVVSKKEFASGKDLETSGHFLSRLLEQKFHLDPPIGEQELGAWPGTHNKGVDRVENKGENYATGSATRFRDKRGALVWREKAPVKKKGATTVRNRWRGRHRPQVAKDDDDDDDDCSNSSSSEEEDNGNKRKGGHKPWKVKRRGRGNSFKRGNDDGRHGNKRPPKRCRKNRGRILPTVTSTMPTTTTKIATTASITSTQPPTTTVTQVSKTTAVVKTTQILTITVSQSSDPQTNKQISTTESTTVHPMSSSEDPPPTLETKTTPKTLGIYPEPRMMHRVHAADKNLFASARGRPSKH